jgi:uncharacterized membrane protein
VHGLRSTPVLLPPVCAVSTRLLTLFLAFGSTQLHMVAQMNERSLICVVAASVLTLLLLLRSISSSSTSNSSAGTQHHSDHQHASHDYSGMDHDNMMMMPMWFMWTVDTILW